jgi:hypothetical protein
MAQLRRRLDRGRRQAAHRLGRRGKQFTYVASLGITTPDTLKGVTRVSAEEVAELARQPVTIVDTRSQKEYDSEHVRGAILASYLEKSLKEVDFDASKDDFSALKNVPKRSR